MIARRHEIDVDRPLRAHRAGARHREQVDEWREVRWSSGHAGTALWGSRAAAHRYTNTGTVACDSTFCVTLPIISLERPRRPCEAMKITSHFLFLAASTMPS